MNYDDYRLRQNINNRSERKYFYVKKKSFLNKAIFFILTCLIIVYLGLNIFMKLNNFDEIVKYSKIYGVDPAQIASIIYAESKFDEYLISDDGRRGVMQISQEMFLTVQQNSKINTLIFADFDIREIEYKDVHDSEINIYLGIWYYKYLLHIFENDERNALCSYDVGIETVNEWLLDKDISFDGEILYEIPNEDTAHYLHSVNTMYTVFRAILNCKL